MSPRGKQFHSWKKQENFSYSKRASAIPASIPENEMKIYTETDDLNVRDQQRLPLKVQPDNLNLVQTWTDSLTDKRQWTHTPQRLSSYAFSGREEQVRASCPLILFGSCKKLLL
jgi:hypothetical protein